MRLYASEIDHINRERRFSARLYYYGEPTNEGVASSYVMKCRHILRYLVIDIPTETSK